MKPPSDGIRRDARQHAASPMVSVAASRLNFELRAMNYEQRESMNRLSGGDGAGCRYNYRSNLLINPSIGLPVYARSPSFSRRHRGRLFRRLRPPVSGNLHPSSAALHRSPSHQPTVSRSACQRRRATEPWHPRRQLCECNRCV